MEEGLYCAEKINFVRRFFFTTKEHKGKNKEHKGKNIQKNIRVTKSFNHFLIWKKKKYLRRS